MSGILYDSSMTCCICLESKAEVINIKVTEISQEDTEISIRDKLEFVAPEHEWPNHYSICKECESLLNSTYLFRLLCYKFSENRNNIVLIEKKEDKFHIPGFDDDFNDDTWYDNDTKFAKVKVKSEKNGTKQTKFVKQHRKKKKKRCLVICYVCSQDFKSKRNLSFHIATKHGLSCHKCNETFNSYKSIEQHIKQKHSELRKRKIAETNANKFQCEFCEKFFPLRKMIMDHYEKIHEIAVRDMKPYACAYCPKRFATSANMIQHKYGHEGVRPHICSFCGKAFISKADLQSHEQIHLNERKFKCAYDNCDKAFNTGKNLQTHILNMHTDRSKWKYTCEFCEKKFSQKSNYEEHKRRHSGIRDFTCQICKKSFSTKSELTRHIKYHSNLRPHKCTECEKEYRERRALTTHLLNVHKIGQPRSEADKKFACHICNASFFENYKLARHLSRHTDVKPFHCGECDKRFIDKSYLTHHLRTVHNVVETLKIEFEPFDEFYTVATI